MNPAAYRLPLLAIKAPVVFRGALAAWRRVVMCPTHGRGGCVTGTELGCLPQLLLMRSVSAR